MLKKICLFTLTLLLLAALNVPPTAAEKPYLEVQVNGDGSVTFFTRGVENMMPCAFISKAMRFNN